MKPIVTKVRELITTAGGTSPHAIMVDTDVDKIIVQVMERVQADANAIGYDGFKGDADSYLSVMWNIVYKTSIRPEVHKLIGELWPDAWFKLMYATREEQQIAMGQEPDHTDD
jgi:hypothetical protein